MTWENLQGNDRIRYCGLCKLNVYNLAGMSRPEIARLVRRSKGRLCGRLYLRGDRTATLRDCPEGRFHLKFKAALTVVASLLLPLLMWFFWTQVKVNRADVPPLVRKALDWIDPERPTYSGTSVVGLICPSPRPAPPAAPPPIQPETEE